MFQPEQFIQLELLVDVAVVVGVQLAHVRVRRPSFVVDSAPPHLDLVIASPTLELTVSPDAPPMAQRVALLEAAVYDDVVVAAEGVPFELDVVDELSQPVGDAGGDEVQTVFALLCL